MTDRINDDMMRDYPIKMVEVNDDNLKFKKKLKKRQCTNGQNNENNLDVHSRKEKSLGLLCQKFLTAMGDGSNCRINNEIHLESVAKSIEVEKRRIYDIVNVMEALEAMTKTNKSFYRWDGLTYLPQLMFQLQKEAENEGLPERIAQVERAMCSFTELSPNNSSIITVAGTTLATELVGSMVAGKNDDSGYWDGFRKESENSGRKQQARFSRERTGHNSLSQLCRRFLMVLLCSPDNKRHVSLDVASTVLIKDPETDGFEPPSRSRCRRLYDIANVLVAMGLIKKLHYLFGTKKIPLFVYAGPEPDENGILEPKDPEKLVDRARRDHEDYIFKKKSRPNCEKPTKNKSEMKTCSSERPPSLMDICEIAERERKRLSTMNKDRKMKVIVKEDEETSVVVRPKAQVLDSHTIESLWRDRGGFRTPWPTGQLSRRMYTAQLMVPRANSSLIGNISNPPNCYSPLPAHQPSLPLKEINRQSSVSHSVTSILSPRHPVNLSRQVPQYRFEPVLRTASSFVSPNTLVKIRTKSTNRGSPQRNSTQMTYPDVPSPNEARFYETMPDLLENDISPKTTTAD